VAAVVVVVVVVGFGIEVDLWGLDCTCGCCVFSSSPRFCFSLSLRYVASSLLLSNSFK